MSYEVTNPIKKIAGGVGGTNGIWSYIDGDPLATIDGAQYFNLEVDRLQVGDLIVAVGNGVAGLLVVLSNDGTDVDCSNVIATVDSD